MTDAPDRPDPARGAPDPEGPSPEPYAPPELRRGLRGRILLFVVLFLAAVALAYGIFGLLLPGS